LGAGQGAVGRGVGVAARGRAAVGRGVSSAGRGTAGVGRGRVEVALELHDNPLIPVWGLSITALKNALLYCSAFKLSCPLVMNNGRWLLNCMGINIPIETELLNRFGASSARLPTFNPVVEILPFHHSFCGLNKSGKPSTLRLASLMLMPRLL